MKWLKVSLTLIFLILMPLQALAAPPKGKTLPEIKKYEPGKRQANSPLNDQPKVQPGPDTPGKDKFDLWSNLEVQVIDGRTKQPLRNAEVVLAETGYRTVTNDQGFTKPFPAPVIRDPRFDAPLGRLHGQLTLIAYKNGYRDTVYFNVRMRENMMTRVQMWMLQITPEDRRIEAYVYFYPTNHLFVDQLVHKFRTKNQQGEPTEELD